MDLIWGILALGIFGAIIFLLAHDAMDMVRYEKHKNDRFWGL